LIFDLTKNPKQTSFFYKVMNVVANPKEDPHRFFFYGGGIRGGKTSVSLTLLYLLARHYPNSRWCVIRDSFPNLQATTIPSFEKFFPEGSMYISRYIRNTGNYHVNFTNGSKIYFKSENIKQDPELEWMLGLEVNGIMLEQVEGLSPKVWTRSLERAGSWYLDDMPPSIILSTFNPTQTWVKDKIYTPWKNGQLKAPYYYEQALPSDSPFITDDQWAAWDNLDSISYRQFIEGDWEAFSSVKRFAYAFDENKHTVPEIEMNLNENLYLSFDFNHSPVTCIIAQMYDSKIYILREVFSTDGLRDLCKKVSDLVGDMVCFVTGDRTGYHQSELLDGNRCAYDIIQDELELSKYQIEAPRVNPNLFKSRELVNSLFENFPEIRLAKNHCKLTINDLKFVEADENHKIIKDRNKEEGKSDFFDCLRYLFNTYQSKFIEL